MADTHKKFSMPEFGLEVEIGKFARQAHGSAWIKHNNTIVLSTAVASEPKDFMGFFPLTVEYRERTSAAGKIPGGYMKREGKLSDAEVLTSRIIDRPIRPLFPSNYFNEVQLISTVYSSDGGFPTPVLATLGTSLALTISKIPFLGPIGAVSISLVDGTWKFNASFDEEKKSDTTFIVSGTKAGICMVEGYCNNLAEEKLIDLLFQAHEIIKKQIDWQLSIKDALAIEPVAVSEKALNIDELEQKISKLVPLESLEVMFEDSKIDRTAAFEKIKEMVHENFATEIEAGEISKSVVNYCFDSIVKTKLPDLIAKKQFRTDGRKLDVVRQINSEVGLLPCVHGSSLFTRGETQALASITLGTSQDAQKVDSLHAETEERSFMLHYNFPPFSTGEVRPMRGVGRREIGHGFLAEKSFFNVLPNQEVFPYTIRSVVDVLESNGSSSMATVCSTTLALMDAGVPIKEMVAGIAMGLIKDSSGNYHILTDILGSEDALGLMDFKVTGTDNGIMAFQLDIKDKVGLSKDLFVKALKQAKEARLHILGEMRKVLTQPRPEISKLAPRVISFKIPQDKIGTIIGPGGKMIKEITAQTETQIAIEDDGTVKVYSKDSEAAKKAETWIRMLTGNIEVGSQFNGIVKKIAEFGLFVELVPGKEGLVHVSTISKEIQRTLATSFKPGDKLVVKVMAVDADTGKIRLVAPELKQDKK